MTATSLLFTARDKERRTSHNAIRAPLTASMEYGTVTQDQIDRAQAPSGHGCRNLMSRCLHLTELKPPPAVAGQKQQQAADPLADS
jgi:hypothetical protein